MAEKDIAEKIEDNILEMISSDKENDKRRAKTALMNILNMERRLLEDFDPKSELQEARKEKYDYFS